MLSDKTLQIRFWLEGASKLPDRRDQVSIKMRCHQS